MAGRILLVEDEDLIGSMVQLNMQAEGYDVSWARDGEQGLQQALDNRHDLIVLDVGLPKMDGEQVLKELRRAEVGTPVLMLTASADIDTKVRSFDLGADDYLTKPFEVEELMARVRALMRRSQADRELPSESLFRLGAFSINFETREAVSNEGALVLTEKETGLMQLFARTTPQVLSRATILDEVWGMDASPTERTVDNVILRLRKLFEEDPDKPVHIVTVRGQGYRFVL